MPHIVEYKYKNNIRNFLAGRSLDSLAERLNVSRQTLVYYAGGRRKPHQLRMIEFLTILGEPWGRVLNIKEVWPDDN